MITFNGIYLKDYFSRIKDIKRPLIPEQELTTITIPKRAGAYKANRRDGVRLITVKVQTFEKDLERLQAKFDTVKEHLIVDDPAPLTFDDQPGRTYYAMITGNTDIDQMYVIGENEIQFICLDPYAYGAPKTANTTTDTATVNVEGNKETFPKYKFTFKNQATAIAVRHPLTNKQLLIGIPENVDMSTVNPKALFLHDQCNSLTNWVVSTAGVDGGSIAGSMAIQDGARFFPSSYGTGSGWHGPAIHRELSKDLQDFEAELTLTQNNAYRDRIGRVEIYLTDGSDNVIAKLAMKDIKKDYSSNHGEVRLGTLGGGEYLVSRDSDNSGWWNNFTGGKMIIRREGKRISGRVARVDPDGREFNIQYFDFYDKDNTFQRPFRRIRVHIGVHGTAGPTTQTMDDIKIYELNVVNEQSIPLIANSGDEITVNMADGDIRKNGSPFPMALNLLSDFFPLQPGENTVEIFPTGKADTEITYDPRWL
jgi:predicted phage tail component-like protein